LQGACSLGGKEKISPASSKDNRAKTCIWEYMGIPCTFVHFVCIRAQNEWTVPEVTRFIEIACRSKFGSEKTEYYKQLVIDNDVDGEVIPSIQELCVPDSL
jgi:hypothetical protein